LHLAHVLYHSHCLLLFKVVNYSLEMYITHFKSEIIGTLLVRDVLVIPIWIREFNLRLIVKLALGIVMLYFWILIMILFACSSWSHSFRRIRVIIWWWGCWNSCWIQFGLIVFIGFYFEKLSILVHEWRLNCSWGYQFSWRIALIDW
jgi:hypothetical protein